MQFYKEDKNKAKLNAFVNVNVEKRSEYYKISLDSLGIPFIIVNFEKKDFESLEISNRDFIASNYYEYYDLKNNQTVENLKKKFYDIISFVDKNNIYKLSFDSHTKRFILTFIDEKCLIHLTDLSDRYSNQVADNVVIERLDSQWFIINK